MRTSLRELYMRRFRKIRNGYHINNYLEKRKNQKILKKNRLKYLWINEPLVSVIIPTYNRAKLLTERTIPSVLEQTYQNFEIIIIGDHCTDDTQKRLKQFKDNRIKFHNLPEHCKYPKHPLDKWMVAGSIPANKAIELSSGDWIAPLDDDDEFCEDHIGSLLEFALKNEFEMVYGKVEMEIKGKWHVLGSYPLKLDGITNMAALYSSILKFIKYDNDCWKYLEPNDWNLYRRMMEAGAKIGFLDKIIGKHYSEGSNHPKLPMKDWEPSK